jgi:transcriptional regulator with XRE-family HTH domain
MNYREYLHRELSDRRGRNAAYSLRAFARDLGVSVTALSDVLAGKRDFSRRNALRIAEKLAFSPEQTKEWLGDVGVAAEFFRPIDEDTFRLIADWYFFAILSLARLKKSRSDETWIAKRLGISVLEARGALQLLTRLGLVDTSDGKLRRTTEPLRTSTNVPSAALRKHHKQNLRLAELSIDRDPLEARENCSVTMAIDPSRIAEAKRRMARFKESLSDLLEGGRPSEVYTLSLHLFPATKKENR